MGAVFFLGGVALHSLFPWSTVPSSAWLCAGIFFVIAWGVLSRARRTHLWWFIFLALGVLRFDFTIPSAYNGLVRYAHEQIFAQGRLISASSFHGGSRILIAVDTANGRGVSGPGNVLSVSLFGRSPPSIGSRVEVTCDVKPVQDAFFARNGIWTECGSGAQISLREKPVWWDVPAILFRWHDALTSRIARLFPADEATLLSGILYGDQDLSAAQRDLMKRAGLMHLVAVSGSNVTIVVTVLMTLALAMGLHRRHAFWIVSIGIVVFSVFVGGSSSVLRAAVMGWLALLARHIGRAPQASRLLLVSATALVVLNPWSLGFDAGFALSFLATWGLLAWTPVVQGRVPWIPERFGLRDIFSTTASATIMTLPYLAWMSGQMSLAGLFTNMLALPLVPFIMLWGAFAATWGSGWGFTLFRTPTLGLLELLERVAHLSDLVPILDVHVTSMSFVAMIACYVALFFIWCQLTADFDLFTVFRSSFQKVSREHVT